MNSYLVDHDSSDHRAAAHPGAMPSPRAMPSERVIPSPRAMSPGAWPPHEGIISSQYAVKVFPDGQIPLVRPRLSSRNPSPSDLSAGSVSQLMPGGMTRKIPVVIIHPNCIIRFGIHHAWATSTLMTLRGVAAEPSEIHDVLASGLAEVAVLGLPTQTERSEEQSVAEIERLIS